MIIDKCKKIFKKWVNLVLILFGVGCIIPNDNGRLGDILMGTSLIGIALLYKID